MEQTERKKMVRWDELDKKDLLDLVFPMVMKHPADSLIILVNKAIAQLPREKQRRIVSLSSIEWLIVDIRNRFKEMQQQSGKVHIQTVVKRIHTDLDQVPLEDLATAFFKRMFQQNKEVKSALSEIQAIVCSNGNGKVHHEEKKPKKKKVKIVIIGLLPEQRVHTNNNYGYSADLVFMDQRDEKKLPNGTDYVVSAIKYRPESWMQAILDQVEQERVYTCEGGLSKLNIILDNIIELEKVNNVE